MTTANWDYFEIDGGEIELVTSFTFLWSEVEKEAWCDKEIKRKVAIGKATMIGSERLWRDKHLSIDTEKDSENNNFSREFCMTVRRGQWQRKWEKKINACEMWIWRKMQRISWTKKKTNESVRFNNKRDGRKKTLEKDGQDNRGGDLGGTVHPTIWGGGQPMHPSSPIFWGAVLSDARESTNRVKKGVMKGILHVK